MTERIRKARAAVDAAAGKRKVIEFELEHAAAGVNAARSAYSQTVKGERRVRDVITIIDVCYGGELFDADLAIRFARVLLSGAMWARTAMPGSKTARLRSSIEFVAKVIPVIPAADLEGIGRDFRRYTNAEAAMVLGVTWEMHCRLGLRMIGACDLSDEEFKHRKDEQRKERDRIRKQEKAKAEGKRTRSELREDQRAKRKIIEDFADAEGLKPKTVRNWIASGKVTFKFQRENEFRTSTLIYAETTFPIKGVRASCPRKPRASKPVKAKKKAAASASRDLDSRNTHLRNYSTSADVGRAVAEAFITLRDKITEPVTRALASKQNGSLARAAGPLRAPRKAVGS